MSNVLQTVQETVQQYELLHSGDTVLVALSGGADSVVLLHTMLQLKDVFGLSQVSALHVHHGIRGESADRDEAFVRALCEKLSVPLDIKYVNVPAEVNRTGESVEEAARRLRYVALQSCVQDQPNAKIATAHNADDHVESVLLHLIRGCGAKGACGIPIKRSNIIRPLLACSSQDIREYCDEYGYAYVVDETNGDVRYSRNRVRHEILPSMRRINSSVEHALTRFSHLIAEDDRLLTSMTDELVRKARIDSSTYSADVLKQADPALQRRALQRICHAEYEHIVRVQQLLENNGTVNLPEDVSVTSDTVTLRFRQHTRNSASVSETIVIPVIADNPICFHGKRYVPRVLSYEEYCEISKIHNNLLNYCVSYDMIGETLVLRTRQDGDRIRPFGRGCSKTLKKLMNECQISPDDRQHYPILACDDSVLMVTGLCVDESVAVTDTTKQILWLEMITDHTSPAQA